MLEKHTLLGVAITTSTRKQILSYCSSVFLKSTKQSLTFPITIVTPNAEQIVLAQENEVFCSILNLADIALPDGKPIVWVLKSFAPKLQRISGIDFMEELCSVAAKQRAKVFFVGGSGGVSTSAFLSLQKKYPGLTGLSQDGPALVDATISEAEMDVLVHTIRGRNIRMVFLGFGAPKQEYLIDLLQKRVSGERVILMAVGGSFDVFAGKISRAPGIVQNIGFEWLWRLIQEPWRWKRQLALVRFVQLVLWQKLTNARIFLDKTQK